MPGKQHVHLRNAVWCTVGQRKDRALGAVDGQPLRFRANLCFWDWCQDSLSAMRRRVERRKLTFVCFQDRTARFLMVITVRYRFRLRLW